MDNDGKYQAVESITGHPQVVSAVCPFTSSERNEDVLGSELFGSLSGIQHDDNIGFSLNTYAGYVNAGEYRNHGSSGGIVSWIAAELLETHKVDAVIRARHPSESGIMYSYQVSRTLE